MSTVPETPPRQLNSATNRSGVSSERRASATASMGRRASVRSAMAGMQRFKQSWISIMILKGGIGLGQVATLLTLLILASVLSSPLHHDQTQDKRSTECPRPQLFQSWMAVQIVRLTICWCVSVWVCLRRRRIHRRNEAFTESIQRPTHERMRRLTTPPSLTTLSTNTAVEQPSPISDHESNPRSPEILQTPNASSSDISHRTSSPTSPSPMPSAGKRRRGNSPVVIDVSSDPGHELGDSGREEETLEVRIERAEPEPMGRNSLHSAREIVAQRREEVVELGNDSDWAVAFDRWAPKITKLLGLLSSILFILGNILVFHPLPTTPSCYTASPMLWWGVMSVTGVGWFLLAQVLVMILVVGIGGSVVLAILRKFGLVAQPPEPVPYRSPQPLPLTLQDLEKINLVCYLPTSSDVFGPEEATSVRESALPYRAIRLSEDRATCAICQENYLVPPPGDEHTAEALRLLGCGHVYHAKCIDEWLLQGAGNCPFCNRSVREMLEERDEKEVIQGLPPAVTRGRFLRRSRSR
ncbi:hypothetical protein CI109_104099 [Kwoniella shandongensis]|uniref:Uncharacterized protein n=1 Tax=Kwoniella shandongensis TaxID=1734106 RepID=A0A5M6BX69_9TREE|nr:uncharacterized protein CI109_004016 [Kwoniella shandongensis]KAA5527478.1 hypothetical protein CI109_004016 [Kwoniella shandongensis]